MPPAGPLAALPVLIWMKPVVPELEVPLLKVKAPLTPFVPALEVTMLIVPEDDLIDVPLVKNIEAPVAKVLDPLDQIWSPPGPVELVERPPVNKTRPPIPPLFEDNPAVRIKSPPFPLSPLFAIDITMSPALPWVADPVLTLKKDPVPELLVPE